MIETSRPKKGIDEHEFGYAHKMERYTNPSSDINELGASNDTFRQGVLQHA